MFGFLVGMVMFAAALVWLHRSKQAGVTACASALGLAGVSGRIERRGETAEGLAFYEQLRARGTLAGCGAEVWERQVRRPVDVKYRKSRGSTLTVLELKPGRLPGHRCRLQPTGMMGVVEHLMKGAQDPVATGDAAFDAAFTLYADEAAGALVALPVELRRDMLAFRESVTGKLPSSGAGNLAASLVVGSFEVGPDRVAYGAFGTPSGKIGAHLRQAAPLLARLAGIQPS